ncbi:hypothetical protein B6U90_06195, partial [Thermoplasmatales archaeon ex4484_6]
KLASASGGSFEITNDMDKALDGATIVFPRNWYTGRRYEIGKDEELKIAQKYTDWRYTVERQKKLGNPGYLLHCMPVGPLPDVISISSACLSISRVFVCVSPESFSSEQNLEM